MKLWKISQTVNNDYDTFDSAIVAADSPTEAQEIHPDAVFEGLGWERKSRFLCWASKPEEVMVEWIGEAKEGTQKGVIPASFNAG